MASASGSGAPPAIVLDRRSFDEFRQLVYERAGITLREGKESLVTARVSRRMHQLGLAAVKDYIAHVRADRSGEEMILLLDAISTNTTSFFREPAAFDQLRIAVATWLGQGQRRLRIWCAAASTGEEPYTLAMVLSEVVREQRLSPREVDMAILATDISTRVLDRCRAGLYSEAAMRPVVRELRDRYFERQGEVWRAGDALRALLTFNRLNLAKPPFPMKGPFDMVFCRNVMIYFDAAVRTRLVGEIERLLRPGGYLAVGSAESLAGLSHGYDTVRPAVYRTRG